MKASFLALSLLLVGAVSQAQDLRTFTYTATMVSTGANCSTEAANLGAAFQGATGVAVQSTVCRGQQTFTADGQRYHLYLLGLTYASEHMYTPYVAEVDKLDPVYNAFREKGTGAYATLAECLSDLGNQRALYAANTGLTPVLVTCDARVPDNQEEMDVIGSHFTLRIEGFSTESYSRPASRIYTLSTYGLETMPQALRPQVRALLAAQDAQVVQEGPGVYVYYRTEGPAQVSNEAIGYHSNDAECATSNAALTEILVNAGSTHPIVWCHQNRLMSLHDGGFHLSDVYRNDATRYATYEMCMQDRPFVLSDARYAYAVGAVCTLDTYLRGGYSMSVLRKGL